ncbi:MAG TPA: glycosyltransferase, partial [Lacipirellulaceae bacterium]|nr:glycosyltransferase [Lacipirellulaceae bacterium]
DSPRLLRLVARRGVSVDAAKLGPMTVSMLQGEHGAQRKELDKLVDWLIHEVQPDVVHLSNAMMVGLARRIAEKCGPPVVCSLAGEDIFLEKLPAPYYQQARALLRERIADVDALTALNQYYARRMGEYLSVSPEKIRVIPHGLNLAGHGDRTPRRSDAPQRVGYLARVCADKGLHLLVDACAALASRRGTPIELHAAGYLGAADRRYLDDLQRKAATGPL